MKRRVAVVGMGVVCPTGNSVPEFTVSLREGRSGIGKITVFDPAQLATRIAAEVKLAATELEHRDRKIAFALRAAREAMQDALSQGKDWENEDPRRAGVSLGVGLELFSMDDLANSLREDFVAPRTLRERLGYLQTPSDLCVHMLAKRYRFHHPPAVHVSACAAGADALGCAYRWIATGRCDRALAGGTDSMINTLGVAGFCALGATSTRNEEPEKASRPFDRRRDGFVLGEGAAVLALEEWEHARARGARIYAEIAGYGNSFDAHAITEPHPEGAGALRAMRAALADAGTTADEIDCVNAHGTGTPKNDPAEVCALKNLLGARARSVPIVATKSMLGHLISAAGAVEAVASIVGMRGGWVHPTKNLDEPEESFDLDFVPHTSREHPQRLVLSCSYGFGGQNAALLFRRAD